MDMNCKTLSGLVECGGGRPGVVSLAILVQPFRLERATCPRRHFGRQACQPRGFGWKAALRPLAFFEYECYLRTTIYLAVSRCRSTCPIGFQSPIRTYMEALSRLCPACSKGQGMLLPERSTGERPSRHPQLDRFQPPSGGSWSPVG